MAETVGSGGLGKNPAEILPDRSPYAGYAPACCEGFSNTTKQSPNKAYHAISMADKPDGMIMTKTDLGSKTHGNYGNNDGDVK